jgi:CheY-like chemotaxis protein
MQVIIDSTAAVLGELLSGPSPNISDGLVVAYASSTQGDASRWSCRGLLELDRLLSEPEAKIDSLVILSFELSSSIFERRSSIPSAVLVDPENGIPFIRLPAPPSMVTQVLKSKRAKAPWRDWKGWLIRLEAASRLLDVSNAGYRHSYKNLVAAVRIFLGALQAGHVAIDQAESVLGEMARAEASLGESGELTARLADITACCRRQALLLERLARAKPPQGSRCKGSWATRLRAYERVLRLRAKRPVVPKGYRVLMLDDEYDTRGWKRVLSAVAGRQGEMTFARNWDEALEALRRRPFDIMLLDQELGGAAKTGLELLAPLRSFSTGLPVVMVTAEDNAELALWSLRAGCNSFYAKELEDRSNRSSLDYYERFIEVLVREDWGWERRLRSLWQDFEAKLPLSAQFKGDEPHLRYAFYLLFSQADRTTWWARGPAWINADMGKVEDFVSRAAVLSVMACDNVTIEPPEDDITVRARHPGHAISRDNALQVLKVAVQQVTGSGVEKQRTLDAPTLPAGYRLHTGAPAGRDDGERHGHPEALRLGHLERSRLGAAQFALGHVLRGGGLADYSPAKLFRRVPTSVLDVMKLMIGQCKPVNLEMMRPGGAKVILIDDEGEANGWFPALRLILGKGVEWYATAGEFIRAHSPIRKLSCVVLLDLWLYDAKQKQPSPEEGLRALEELKRHDVAIPVLVLSAATDALNAVRCMKLGALDYVPKWLPGEDGYEHWSAFTDLLLDRIKAALAVGEVKEGSLRTLWGALDEAVSATSPLLNHPRLLGEIRHWEYGGASTPRRVDGLRRAFYQHILPALILHHHHVTSVLTKGQIPPLDDWRVRRVLRSSRAAEDDAILFAGRAAELLGQLRCAMEHPRDFGKESFRKQIFGTYKHWIKRASDLAGQVWEVRNSIKNGNHGSAQPQNTHLLLRKAIASLSDFESKAARELGTSTF